MSPKDRDELVKTLSLALSHLTVDDDKWLFPDECVESAEYVLDALEAAGCTVVPNEATEEMLNSVRDWSYAKYGKPVGNDGAIGCLQALRTASPYRRKP